MTFGEEGNLRLKKMIGQFFVRINLNVFNRIHPASEINKVDTHTLIYDPGNPDHVEIVTLFQRQMNHKIVATNQDVFFSLMQMYFDYLKDGIVQN